jgi:hypothetical protein|nr:hypothetical protein [uncultured Schaedlerella sp.]
MGQAEGNILIKGCKKSGCRAGYYGMDLLYMRGHDYNIREGL